MNDSTLPGCIGYYGKPTKPNKCELCQHAKVCKDLVRKEKLSFVLDAIQETRAILRG